METAKNPRRAYRPDGTEILPLTVGEHLASGFKRAEVHCVECHHHASIDISALPPELPVPDIGLRARCSACGSRNCTSRPDVAEHYERVEAMKRQRT